MGSEAALWDTVRKNMKKYWVHQRVENLAGPGVPDVYFTMKETGTMGWIELKHAHRWPKKESTALKIDHFTKQQRLFIKRHGKAGGNVHVLLQVERYYFLINWRTAQKIGELTKTGYLSKSVFFWKHKINYDQLRELLDQKRPWKVL